MKKSMKFATALAGAAVVVMGGTAFTQGNTGLPASATYGYNEVDATGVAIDTMTVLRDTDDPGLVTSVTFVETSATNRSTGYTATLTTKLNGEDPSTDYDCGITYGSGKNTYLCTTTGLTAEALEIMGFKVVEDTIVPAP